MLDDQIQATRTKELVAVEELGFDPHSHFYNCHLSESQTRAQYYCPDNFKPVCAEMIGEYTKDGSGSYMMRIPDNLDELDYSRQVEPKIEQALETIEKHPDLTKYS